MGSNGATNFQTCKSCYILFTFVIDDLVMAVADFGEAVSQLADEMSRVSDMLGTQSITQFIETNDGNNTKLFSGWVASINKYCQLANLPPLKKKMVALRASTGPVSGFIQRYMDAYVPIVHGRL